MRVAIIGDKNVTAYRKLYSAKRTIGTKNLEVEMFDTVNV